MRLRHARTEIELHELAPGDGLPLLLLHALGGSSADWGELSALWPGRVCGLDFCGHGASEWMRGGVYVPELLAADADIALAQLGHAALIGTGVGAYAALLLAGGRPTEVPAALLLPGRGLAGGGVEPDFDRPWLQVVTPALNPPLPPGCDPRLCALELDPRPADYAARFAAQARRLLLLEDGTARPPWWEAARHGGQAVALDGDLPAAIAHLIDAVRSANREGEAPAEP